MSKLFLLIFLTNFLGINSASSCSSRGRKYKEIYWDADLTMRNTNNICNAIKNHSYITNYYCNDNILKIGLSNFPYPDTECVTSIQVSRLREMRINYEYLNVYICNEIISNQSVVISPEIPREYCMTFGSSSTFFPSYFLGLIIVFIFTISL
jgi:hypothetical protein